MNGDIVNGGILGRKRRLHFCERDHSKLNDLPVLVERIGAGPDDSGAFFNNRPGPGLSE